MNRLSKAATIAMKEVLTLRRGEEVLIVTNPHEGAFAVAVAYCEAAMAAGGRPTMVASPVKDRLEQADRLTTRKSDGRERHRRHGVGRPR